MSAALERPTMAETGGPVEPRTVSLLKVDLHAVSERECIDQILASSLLGTGGSVVTVNLDILRRCVLDDGFRRLSEKATLRVADGMPLVWASRLQRTPLPERVAGSSLVVPLCHAAATRGRSVFLLGGDPGTAETSAEVLRREVPGLKISGVYCPPFCFERSELEKARIQSVLKRSQPDIVFVALGSPKQERLIDELRPAFPSTWWLGVGISFSFLAGEVRRAPRWMQRMGLEWVHRLAQEPGRLGRRYLVDGVPFALRLLVSSTMKRFRNRPALEA